MDNIYQDNGYDSRDHYLKFIAEDNEVDLDTVLALADILGPDEDFDGLVVAIEDM